MIAKDEVIKALEVLVAYCEQYEADMSGICCIPYTKDYPRSCVFWDYCYYNECSVCEKMKNVLKVLKMTKKYLNIRCPFCGKNAIHVTVCDNEGNIHGFIGCEYEDDPWSGLGYVLIHDGWGECILCTDGDQGCLGGMVFDTPDEAVKALKMSPRKDNTNLY